MSSSSYEDLEVGPQGIGEGMSDRLPDEMETTYVPEPPRNLKTDEREWRITVPVAPEGHHVEVELPRHHGLREPKVTVVKDKAEEGKDGNAG